MTISQVLLLGLEQLSLIGHLCQLARLLQLGKLGLGFCFRLRVRNNLVKNLGCERQ
jgi:hypothetical protein